MIRKHDETTCNLANLAPLVGGRVMSVLSEIASHLDVNGSAKIDWSYYRVAEKMRQQNLQPILKDLEESGVICREVTREGTLMQWGNLWVNPLVMRHIWSREEFLPNNARTFYKRRMAALAARGIDPDTFVDPCARMFSFLDNPRPRYTLKRKPSKEKA